jgi:ABC-type antimicrobial peptide transport system permease subunit
MLAVSEQHQEFGVLRALGVKPKGVISIISWQILVVLFASYAFGVAFGIIITLLILFPEPVITNCIVIQIAVSLLAALIATFLISLYPAVRFARKPTLEVLAQP